MTKTPTDIAKYFRESITFDLKNNPINTYKQIKDAYDDFFTLIDREAFIALLNDILYYDNQLKDIFCDLYDTELGIQCFANQDARKYPRMRITYFLTQPKYQYHKNNITKIYFAINTWLAFFDENIIEPEWEKCPFCGKPIKNNICTGIYCGKTREEAMKAAIELSNLLLEAKEGITISTPSYWYNIEEGSEFYNDYKSPILTYTKKQRDQEEEKKQNTINEGIKELNKIKAALIIEIDKENPNFDNLLTNLSSSNAIKDASAFNDRSFTQKLNQIKKQIIKKQDEQKTRKELSEKFGSFNDTIDHFITAYTRLNNALTIKKLSINTFKEILDETNQLYEKINLGIKNGYQIKNENILKTIKQYENTTQVKATEYIVEKIEQAAINDAKNELVEKTNLILIDLEKTSPLQNKAELIENNFLNNIEKNHYFDNIRINHTIEYNYIVDPIRKKISNLVEEENKLKLDAFKKDCKELTEEINHTDKTEKSIKYLIDQLNLIIKNDYYKTIRSRNEYIKLIGILNRKIDNLSLDDKTKKLEEENKNLSLQLEQITKQNKLHKNIFIITVISLSIIIIILIISILLII